MTSILRETELVSIVLFFFKGMTAAFNGTQGTKATELCLIALLCARPASKRASGLQQRVAT